MVPNSINDFLENQVKGPNKLKPERGFKPANSISRIDPLLKYGL
jgi:hypothetical protein